MRSPLLRELNRLLAHERRSRREFLRSLAVTGAAFALPSCAHTQRKDVTPVIILGAGIAGLTAAFYLTRAGYPCEIYEASARTGGRIYTLENFNRDGMSCELGGELVDSNHEDLLALCKLFQIPVD